MVVHVVPHEGGDEIVGVVVQGLHAHLDRVPNLATSSREVPRLELSVQEPISSALVNQDARLGTRVCLHQLGSIVLSHGSYRAKIPGKSLAMKFFSKKYI